MELLSVLIGSSAASEQCEIYLFAKLFGGAALTKRLNSRAATNARSSATPAAYTIANKRAI
ncbi:MAG: hypothetical protein C0508_31075 [Cyanobacteria bacterium PR.023]|nr:hypothetical protein [Cyanobacteria bacterium PR.023]